MNYRPVTHSKKTGRNQVYKPPPKKAHLKGRNMQLKDPKEVKMTDQDAIALQMFFVMTNRGQ